MQMTDCMHGGSCVAVHPLLLSFAFIVRFCTGDLIYALFVNLCKCTHTYSHSDNASGS